MRRGTKECFELVDKADMEQVGPNEFQADMPHPRVIRHLDALLDGSLCALLRPSQHRQKHNRVP